MSAIVHLPPEVQATLRGCPFCGQTNERLELNDDSDHEYNPVSPVDLWVRCKACLACGPAVTCAPTQRDPVAAAREWNTRADHAAKTKDACARGYAAFRAAARKLLAELRSHRRVDRALGRRRPWHETRLFKSDVQRMRRTLRMLRRAAARG